MADVAGGAGTAKLSGVAELTGVIVVVDGVSHSSLAAVVGAAGVTSTGMSSEGLEMSYDE